MESNVYSYKLNQKNKDYILTIELKEPEIILTCKDSTQKSSVFKRTFTIESLKKLDSIFSAIQTLQEAIQWFDKTLNVDKVHVEDENSSFKLVFFIKANGITQQVEIPMNEDAEIATNVNNEIITSTDNQIIQGINISSDTNGVNAIREFGLDPAKVVRQTMNENTAQIIKSIEDEQRLRISQIKNVDINNLDNYTQTQLPVETNINYQIQAETNNIDTIPELNQYTTSSTAQYGETNIDYSQFKTENVLDANTQYITSNTNNDLLTQYTEATPFTQTFGEENINIQETSDQINYEGFQTTTTPDITEYSGQILSSFESNTITPTIESENIQTNINLESQEFIPSSIDNTFGQMDQFNSTETTPLDLNFGNIEPKLDLNNYNEYQETTQFDTQNLNINELNNYDYNTNIIEPYSQDYQGSLLGKLENDTYNLKNEHQVIENKLSNLYGQVNAYKNHLDYIEKEKMSNEVLSLRAENEAIKQQLSQYTNLRNESFDVQNLKNQMSIISPLRRKVGEIDVIKGQLNEIPYLRTKVDELSGLKSQLGEINDLKTQVDQMNIIKQQMNEISTLKAKVSELINSQLQKNNQDNEKEILKKKLIEIENLKIELEQELKDVKETKKKEEKKEEDKKEEEEIKDEDKKEEKKEEEIKDEKKEVIEESSNKDKKEILIEDKIQHNIVKGDIIHSKEELELITGKINKDNKKITLNLLYKATVDSDRAEVFHQKCDKAKSTLVLVETNKGKRFGGFTTCSWEGDCEDKMDEDAFIFSLNKMMTYDNIPEEEAIGCYPKFGPIFLGCQIRIYDNAFTKGGTTFEKRLNYNTEEDYELTEGDRIFDVKEIEVYEVITE